MKKEKYDVDMMKYDVEKIQKRYRKDIEREQKKLIQITTN